MTPHDRHDSPQRSWVGAVAGAGYAGSKGHVGQFEGPVVNEWGSMQQVEGMQQVEDMRQRYGTYGPGGIEGIRLMHNVRELGGYVTEDGRRVRHGLLLRGSRLANLSADELGVIERMGPRTVLDLRAETEAVGSPDPELPEARYLRVGGMYLPGTSTEIDFSPQQMRELFGADSEGGLSTVESIEAGAARMLPLYLGMPFDNPGFRALFDLLRAGEVPVYFHCAAGKDRTGIAALLVLLALGVSAEAASYDYALTNAYRAELIEAELASRASMIAAHPEIRRPVEILQGVNPDMSAAVIAEIERRFGTLGRYFAEEYGLGEAELAQLRRTYTEG